MRLTRTPLRRPPHRRTDGRRPHRGRIAPPLAATRPVRQTSPCTSRPATDTPDTPPTYGQSTGRRTTVRRRLILITEVAALALLLSASAVHAQTTQVLALAGSVDEVLTNIRNWVMGILAGLATVFLSIGGVRYVMGGGDPGEIEKAKVAFKAAGIGYALAALAPLVVTVLKGIVGA